MESELQKYGFVEKISSNSYYVRVANNQRKTILTKIARDFQGFYNPTLRSRSSLGRVDVDKIKIYVKPINRKGDFSSGKQNEIFLLNQLTQFENISSLVFYSDDKSICVSNFLVAEDISKLKSNDRKHKGDIKIRTVLDDFYVSVKMTTSEYWESSDRYVGHLVKHYISELCESGKVKLHKTNGVHKVSPNIAIECTEQESNHVIFGDDVSVKGFVVVKDFALEDFFYTSNVLYIYCDQIIESYKDLKEEQKPYFLIRNDSTRNCGYKGIRVLACYQKRVNNSVYVIDKKQRTDTNFLE